MRVIQQLRPGAWRVVEEVGGLRLERTVYEPPEGWKPPEKQLPEGVAAVATRPPRRAEQDPIDRW